MTVMLAGCRSVPSEDEVCSAFDPRLLVSLEDSLFVLVRGDIIGIGAKTSRDSARAFEFMWRTRRLGIGQVRAWPGRYVVETRGYRFSNLSTDGPESRRCRFRAEIWPDTVYVSKTNDE